MSTRAERFADKSLNDRHTKILKELMQRADNKRCADCRKKDPRWASWNLGIFICIRCSGVHRSMGTHISKVKSADLDTWTPEQIENMIRWGNGKANQYWEGELPPNFDPPESNIDNWIRAKYDRKQYVLKGAIPNPDDLALPEGVAPVQLSVAAKKPTVAAVPAQAAQPPKAPQTAQLVSTAPSAGSSSSGSGANDLFAAFQSSTENTPKVNSQPPLVDLKANIMSLYTAPPITTSQVNSSKTSGTGQLQGAEFFNQPSFANFGAFSNAPAASSPQTANFAQFSSAATNISSAPGSPSKSGSNGALNSSMTPLSPQRVSTTTAPTAGGIPNFGIPEFGTKTGSQSSLVDLSGLTISGKSANNTGAGGASDLNKADSWTDFQ